MLRLGYLMHPERSVRGNMEVGEEGRMYSGASENANCKERPEGRLDISIGLVAQWSLRGQSGNWVSKGQPGTFSFRSGPVEEGLVHLVYVAGTLA